MCLQGLRKDLQIKKNMEKQRHALEKEDFHGRHLATHETGKQTNKFSLLRFRQRACDKAFTWKTTDLVLHAQVWFFPPFASTDHSATHLSQEAKRAARAGHAL